MTHLLIRLMAAAVSFALVPEGALADGKSPAPITLAQQAVDQVFNRTERQIAQSGLNALGMGAGQADGVFGRGTRAAIQRYQASRGYPVTGFLTRPQFSELQAAHAQASGNNPQQARLLTQDEFRTLQSGLKTLGWYGGAIDGVAGNATMTALESFLRSQGRTTASTPPVQMLQLVQQALLQTPGASQSNPGAVAAASPSFDCARAALPSERTICGSEPLARLDRAIAEAFKIGMSQQPWARREQFTELQRNWLALRNQCGVAAECLRDQMVARIQQLAPGSFTQLVTFAQEPGYLSGSTASASASGGAAQAPAAPEAGNRSYEALAREFGIPTKNGYLVAVHPQFRNMAPALGLVVPGATPSDDGWARLVALLNIARNPDGFREGEAFVRIAATFLKGAEFDAFFPDRARLNQALAYGGLEEWNTYNAHPFGDEFAYAEKKEEFFARYYPSILAKIPEGPIPIMHVVPMALGSYDIEKGVFPLSTTRYGRQVKVHVAAFPSDRDANVLATIASAEMLEQLPDTLALPLEQARLLRAEKGTGNATVYLGWFAELDWSAGVEASASVVEPGFGVPNVPRGRGTLKHIALYNEPTLMSPIVQYDPESFGPKPTAAPGPAESAITENGIDFAKIIPASPTLLLRHVHEKVGGSFAADLARRTNAMRTADEFNRAEVLQAELSKFLATPLAEIWLQGQTNIGEYDLSNGRFDLRNANFYLGIPNNPYRTKIDLQLLNAPNLGFLEVPRDLAELLVSYGRTIKYHVLIDPEKVAPSEGAVSVFARARAIAFFYDDPRTREPIYVAGQIIETSAPTATGDAQSENFAEQTVDFTLASAGLLYAAELPEANRKVFLEALLPLIWDAENGGKALPGTPFFPSGVNRPAGAVRSVFIDDFTPWAAAKAEAIRPATFRLTDKNYSYSAQDCETGSFVQANTSYARSPLGVELGIDAVQAARREAQASQTPVVVREILHYTGSLTEDRQPCRFSDWNIFADIANGATSDSHTERVFLAKLKTVRLAPGTTALSDAVFGFEAIETALSALDGGRTVVRGDAPSLEDANAKAAAEEAARLYEPAHLDWQGRYQCTGVTAASVGMTFQILGPDRIGATITFQIEAPYPETGSFYVEGSIDKTNGNFSFMDGRWIYNANGRPVPKFTGRFVEGGKAIDIADVSGQCYGFDLRPASADAGAAAAVPNPVPAPAASPAQPSATAPRPDLGLSTMDVVGIQTGMTMSDAQEILLREFRIAAVYETIAPVTGDLQALGYARVFIGDQAGQTITLLGQNRTGPVVAIARHAVQKTGAFDHAGLGNRLAEKYGSPATTADDGSVTVWADDAACGPLPLRAMQRRNFNPIQGVSSGGTLPGQTDLQYAVSDIGVLLAGDAADSLRRKDCKTVVQYGTTSFAPRAGVSVFYVFMVDLDRVRAIDGTPEGAPRSDTGGEIKL